VGTVERLCPGTRRAEHLGPGLNPGWRESAGPGSTILLSGNPERVARGKRRGVPGDPPTVFVHSETMFSRLDPS
jgi:hypothetical protein